MWTKCDHCDKPHTTTAIPLHLFITRGGSYTYALHLLCVGAFMMAKQRQLTYFRVVEN